MAKTDCVVIPFPKPASPASVDRPTPNALLADAHRALLNDLILLYGRTLAQGRNGHE